MCVSINIGLLVFFRRRFARQGTISKVMSASAYPVYIIHAPLIMMLAAALRDVHLFPLLKFALVSLLAIPLCFGCGYLLRKLPLARSIL